MAETPVLQITSTRIKARLNPLNNPDGFDFGGSTNITEADLIELATEQEDIVISALPEKYRTLTEGEIEGEIVTRDAAGGETGFTLSLFPVVANTLYLYKNFGIVSTAREGIPSNVENTTTTRRPYDDRKKSEALGNSAYTLTPATGVVVLTTALAAGDTLHADYQHQAAYKCKLLRNIVLDLVQAQIYDDYPQFNTTQQDVLALRTMANGKLNAFYAEGGRISGIRLFDKIPLENETRRNERKTLRMPILRGF